MDVGAVRLDQHDKRRSEIRVTPRKKTEIPQKSLLFLCFCWFYHALTRFHLFFPGFQSVFWADLGKINFGPRAPKSVISAIISAKIR